MRHAVLWSDDICSPAPFDRVGFVRRMFTTEEIGKVAEGETQSFSTDEFVVPIPMRFGGPLRLSKIVEGFGGTRCTISIWDTWFAVANNEVYLFGELDAGLHIGGLSLADFQAAQRL